MNALINQVNSIYTLLTLLPVLRSDYLQKNLPNDGIYFFFEDGEVTTLNTQVKQRVVRIGINTKDGRFRKRIRQHFYGNRYGSIFRQHVGGAIARSEHLSDDERRVWAQQKGPKIPVIEEKVSRLLSSKFSFCCVNIGSEAERIRLETGLIALLAQCKLGRPSDVWLGNYAKNQAIHQSGLWNVRGISDNPLCQEDLLLFESRVLDTVALYDQGGF